MIVFVVQSKYSTCKCYPLDRDLSAIAVDSRTYPENNMTEGNYLSTDSCVIKTCTLYLSYSVMLLVMHRSLPISIFVRMVSIQRSKLDYQAGCCGV